MGTDIKFIGNGGSSELTTLETIINRELIIPSYQRSYAWDEDNIEDLFNTIKESFEAEGNISDKKNHFAFFGSVIFSSQNIFLQLFRMAALACYFSKQKFLQLFRKYNFSSKKTKRRF